MENLVIIGCGMATNKLVEDLLPNNKYKITIIGKEKYHTYDRIKLIQLLKEDDPENFWLKDFNWYKNNGIELRLKEKVIKIERAKKLIITELGGSVPYDKLVIATGSIPYIPNIDGVNQTGVFVLRELDDVKLIKNYIQNKNRVLVIGGGLLGLELAYTLHEIGKEVTVSHLVDSLMEQNLNKEASLFLYKKFNELGINFIMNTYATNIIKNENGSFKVDFKNSEVVETDAIIINCGIIPEKSLATTAGLATNKGIIVNERLQTTDENIYAIGECIEYKGKTYGLLAPIYQQARILSKILKGIDVVYEDEPLPPVKLKSNIPAIAMGKINENSDDDVIIYKNPITNIFKKVIIKDNKILGAHFVGEDLNTDAIGVYYTSGLPLPVRIEQLLFPGVHKEGSTSSIYWPESLKICDCNGVTCKEIRESIKRNKGDIDKVIFETKAATSCGNCKNRIKAIIENTFDVIVVGAGLGGLSCGATLSKYGKKVLVIEKHDKVGGYGTAFTRLGYKFDVSLHNIGPINSSIAKIFEDLELTKKVEYIPFNNFQRVIFPKHDIVIPKGIDNFIKLLSELFPEEKEGIKELLSEIKYIRKGFDEFEELSLGGNPEEMINPMMAVQYPQFVELVYVTFKELMERYIKNEELKGIVANLWWYFGLPPSKVASILYSVPSANYFEHGGGYIKGTSQNLSDSLAEIILSNHGKIILNCEVKKILIDEGKAKGVLTDQGEIFYGDLIISNAGAKNTFLRLVDKEMVKKRYIKKVEEQEISLSAVQLYLGLDCSLEELGIKDHSFTVFFTYDHDENFNYIMNGEYDKTFFSCTCYTLFDKTLAPENKGIINIFSLDHIKNWENLTPSEYQKKKKEVTEIIIKKVEKFIPDLSKHIVVKELGTPKTMFRYTFNPEGSIYGPSQIVEQSGVNRLQPFTPVKGLFIVGSSIYPGGGYPSVISSGYKTAKMILYQESKTKIMEEEKVH